MKKYLIDQQRRSSSIDFKIILQDTSIYRNIIGQYIQSPDFAINLKKHIQHIQHQHSDLTIRTTTIPVDNDLRDGDQSSKALLQAISGLPKEEHVLDIQIGQAPAKKPASTDAAYAIINTDSYGAYPENLP